MKKIALLSLIFAIHTSVAFAVPSSANVSVTAQQVRSSTNPLLMNVTHSFDSSPGTRCIIRLYGKLSATDGSAAGSTVRLMTKSSSARRVKFTYRGPSARVSSGDQKQLNFQTISTCGSTRIVSSVAATNVTCTRGVADTSFVKLVRDRIRGVFHHRTSDNAAGGC